jgi:hypothetical protein
VKRITLAENIEWLQSIRFGRLRTAKGGESRRLPFAGLC